LEEKHDTSEACRPGRSVVLLGSHRVAGLAERRAGDKATAHANAAMIGPDGEFVPEGATAGERYNAQSTQPIDK
jgi:hypothetical protein